MEKTISDWLKDDAHSGIKIKLEFIPSDMNGPACMAITMVFMKFPMRFKNSTKDFDYIQVSNTSYIDYADLSDEKIAETLNSMHERGSKQWKSVKDEFGY